MSTHYTYTIVLVVHILVRHLNKKKSFILLPTFHIHVHIICHNHLPVVYKIYYYTYKGKNYFLQRGYFFIPIQGRIKHPHTPTHTHAHKHTTPTF